MKNLLIAALVVLTITTGSAWAQTPDYPTAYSGVVTGSWTFALATNAAHRVEVWGISIATTDAVSTAYNVSETRYIPAVGTNGTASTATLPITTLTQTGTNGVAWLPARGPRLGSDPQHAEGFIVACTNAAQVFRAWAAMIGR